MSSYRGAWDGGPPGAEGEYGEPPIPGAGPPAAAAPPTDPWTGVSYGHYAPGLDYAAYSGYAYGYDPSGYYRRPDGSYYAPAAGHCAPSVPAAAPPPPPPGLEYSRRPRTPSPRSQRSPPRRYRERSPDYGRREEEPRRRRERSRSRSRDRRNKYSSSDRSRSRSPRALKRSRRRKSSSESSASDRSFQRKGGRSRRGDRSPTASPRRSPRRRSESESPRFERDRSLSGGDPKYQSGRDDSKCRDRKRVVTTPPRKKRNSVTPPPKTRKDRSVTPPRTYKKDRDRSLTPPKSYKYKSDTPPRKARNSSITPPKSYARSGSVSSDKSDKSGSKSSDKSPPPPPSRRLKRSPRRRSLSASSSDSGSSGSPREHSKAKRKESKRRSKSRSRSRSNRRSRSKSKSKSRRRSRSKEGRKKRSVSPRCAVPPKDGKARSPGGTPSDDEQRRGQFTVADRKRFWKMHKYRQEKDPKTPPKEVKPPPGAVESTTVDDVEYGVPPDLEGPNFAELLPPPDMALLAQASSSKSKPVVPVIKNDGSFLEMFKKMQEATKKAEEAVKPVIKKPTLPFIGKRRGGRVLKTGVVKKAKAIDEQTVDNAPKDAWSLYMQEVKKYRETSCEEERKTRPLVK